MLFLSSADAMSYILHNWITSVIRECNEMNLLYFFHSIIIAVLSLVRHSHRLWLNDEPKRSFCGHQHCCKHPGQLRGCKLMAEQWRTKLLLYLNMFTLCEDCFGSSEMTLFNNCISLHWFVIAVSLTSILHLFRHIISCLMYVTACILELSR